MKWSIPAKTFLLGEYAAILGAPAIVVTTTPCFELSLTDLPGLHGIHPDSPAGRWWTQNGQSNVGLQWYDPYEGCGGMGASSAQFIGAYHASMSVHKKRASQEEMFAAYMQYAWSGEGLRPSGYDVMAQWLSGCVYLDRGHAICQLLSWPFPDLAFLLLHTGTKLATHHHLQSMELPSQVGLLGSIVDLAKGAFERADSHCLIDAVNAYHQQLTQMDLVALHSLQYITLFQQQADVLAVKGCGAMGADVLLLLVSKTRLSSVKDNLSTMHWRILATSESLYHP